MFQFIAKLVIRRSWLVILAWSALAGSLLYGAPRWEQITKDDDVRFFPAGFPSVVGQDLLERGFPRDASSSQIVLVYERSDSPLTPGDLTYVRTVADGFLAHARDQRQLGVKKIDTHLTPVIGPRLIGGAADGRGQAVLTIISLDSTYLSKRTRIAVDLALEYMDHRRPPAPDGLRLSITGSAVVGHDMNSASKESIHNTTTTTIGLVIVILLIVYRSPLLAMIPLFTIALSVIVSLRLLALAASQPWLGFQVINITQVFVVVVLFGAGTDYCLFLIARYREELARGRARLDALREAISQVGSALVASAGTVIVGLGMLFFSSFAKIRYTGPAIALSLSVALIAALTLAPVLLYWLRGAIFWPFRPPQPKAEPAGPDLEPALVNPSGFWGHVADALVKHPLLILLGCLSVLTPFAVVGARTHSSYSQLADMDPDRRSVIGANVIKHYFAVGELSPTSILLNTPRLAYQSPAGLAAIREISGRLNALENVAEVRSLYQPLGKPPTPEADLSFVQRLARRALRAAAESRYVSLTPAREADRSHITRIDLVLGSDPFSSKALETLESVQRVLKEATLAGQPLEGTEAIGMVGSTAAVYDLKTVTTADERRMYLLVTLGVYAVLIALLRRPGVCLYLIFTVILGYLASLGATELVFRALHRGPAPWGGLDWTVGFFLFVILVAVGEDYNILLMARVIEEEAKHGITEGTRRAVAHTGGIISSCGLIMAGTFGSMLTGSLTSLRELGFALGLGIILDTFLVRPVLVPAFVILLDRSRRERRPRRRPRPEGIGVEMEPRTTVPQEI
jgi:RND superfamily putative drug exporter